MVNQSTGSNPTVPPNTFPAESHSYPLGLPTRLDSTRQDLDLHGWLAGCPLPPPVALVGAPPLSGPPPQPETAVKHNFQHSCSLLILTYPTSLLLLLHLLIFLSLDNNRIQTQCYIAPFFLPSLQSQHGLIPSSPPNGTPICSFKTHA
ncbi:unnamed protein product [Periconia digitata]|uniref:Uncharacterized protein n=1 Tax=Periconia digitata TaxID=1303443 RepID=A0A9W4XM40_9PLEO|nr:unnamed protein product [Periconia digitata]